MILMFFERNRSNDMAVSCGIKGQAACERVSDQQGGSSFPSSRRVLAVRAA